MGGCGTESRCAGAYRGTGSSVSFLMLRWTTFVAPFVRRTISVRELVFVSCAPLFPLILCIALPTFLDLSNFSRAFSFSWRSLFFVGTIFLNSLDVSNLFLTR